MFHKLKQFKELRDKSKAIQKALAEEKVETTAASGRIRITMNGNQEIIAVSIDPALPKGDLERGVKDATNEAIKKIQRVMAEKVKAMGGLPQM